MLPLLVAALTELPHMRVNSNCYISSENGTTIYWKGQRYDPLFKVSGHPESGDNTQSKCPQRMWCTSTGAYGRFLLGSGTSHNLYWVETNEHTSFTISNDTGYTNSLCRGTHLVVGDTLYIYYFKSEDYKGTTPYLMSYQFDEYYPKANLSKLYRRVLNDYPIINYGTAFTWSMPFMAFYPSGKNAVTLSLFSDEEPNYAMDVVISVDGQSASSDVHVVDTAITNATRHSVTVDGYSCKAMGRVKITCYPVTKDKNYSWISLSKQLYGLTFEKFSTGGFDLPSTLFLSINADRGLPYLGAHGFMTPFAFMDDILYDVELRSGNLMLARYDMRDNYKLIGLSASMGSSSQFFDVGRTSLHEYEVTPLATPIKWMGPYEENYVLFVGANIDYKTFFGPGNFVGRCPSNMVPSYDMRTCVACPAGYSCDGLRQTLCPLGTYSTLGPHECTQCPPGTFANKTGMSECTKCPRGQYQSQSGEKTCVACPDGEYVVDANGEATFSGAVDHKPCGDNYVCRGGLRFQCPGGQYLIVSLADSGVLECKACEPGFECDGLERQACGVGYFSAEPSSTSCTLCPNGNYTAAEGSDELVTTEATRCLGCQEGYACKGSTREKCGSTFYSEAGASECTQCPAGFQCVDGILGDECPTGFFSAKGVDECVACADGYTVDSDGNDIRTGAADCIPCDSEHLCVGGTRYRCQPGQFLQITEGEEITAGCQKCGPGEYSDSYLATECSHCEEGHYTAAGEPSEFVSDAATACLLCEAGYACSGSTREQCNGTDYSLPVSTECLACPAGWECTNNILGEKCGPGSFSPEGVATCDICVDGYIVDVNGNTVSDGGADCIPCDDKHLCIGGVAYRCGEGQYLMVTDNEDGTVDIECEDCSPGNECDGLVTTECQEGYYSDSPLASSCTACGAGFYTTEEGNDEVVILGAKECRQCEAGFACEGSRRESCVAQDSDISLYSGPEFSQCEPCPAGHECSGGILTGECGPGTYASPGAGSCIECPDGYFAALGPEYLEPIDQAAAACNICPLGAVCVDNIVSACEKNEFISNVNDPDADPVEEGGIFCVLCPAGKYCDGTTKNECEPGTYQPDPGQLLCINCPGGSSCTPTAATPCSSGTYSHPGDASCSKCAGNTYTRDQGATDCTPCDGAYNYVNDDHTDCLQCPVGQFANSDHTGCDSCPIGSIERGGECVQCEVGHYADLDENECVACPSGTYSADDRSHCLNCQLGTYPVANEELADAVDTGATMCLECPTMSSCDGKTKTPCKYNLGPGSAICQPCPSDTAWRAGKCEPCDGGCITEIVDGVTITRFGSEPSSSNTQTIIICSCVAAVLVIGIIITVTCVMKRKKKYDIVDLVDMQNICH